VSWDPHSGHSIIKYLEMPQLSCEACNERKVRCDKQSPCSTCVATGVDCIPIHRKRLARGRHVKEREKSFSAENKDLQERLARLEDLVSSRDAANPASSGTASRSTATNFNGLINHPRNAFPHSNPPSTSLPNPKPHCIAGSFWNDLFDKVRT